MSLQQLQGPTTQNGPIGMLQPLPKDMGKYTPITGGGGGSVSYTHLTLPTNREV